MDDADDQQPIRSPGSGLAITALVLGIVGLPGLFPLAITALVLGIIALNKGQSKGLSIAGIVLGGLGTLILPFAIIAAIAIPNLLESRVASNEAAARASLKAGVFPAEVQFQSGAYVDEDKNGAGEAGFFDELSGGSEVNQNRLTLLPQSWRGQEPVIGGYHFVLYVPDGDGAASSRGQIQDHSPRVIKGRELQWIAYAWPVPWGHSGRRAFAITADGTLLATKPSMSGDKPAWNAALSDGWGSAPAAGWEPYSR
jgi:hypothetical protein